jgi:Tfp pilus assembly protein PilF
MAKQILENLLTMLESGKDNALLRFSIGSEFLKAGDPVHAQMHLERALAYDPAYSAAWKLLAGALSAQNRLAQALETYRQGIAVARRRGDKQAAKEMEVFAKRIEKELAGKNIGI